MSRRGGIRSRGSCAHTYVALIGEVSSASRGSLRVSAIWTVLTRLTEIERLKEGLCDWGYASKYLPAFKGLVNRQARYTCAFLVIDAAHQPCRDTQAWNVERLFCFRSASYMSLKSSVKSSSLSPGVSATGR